MSELTYPAELLDGLWATKLVKLPDSLWCVSYKMRTFTLETAEKVELVMSVHSKVYGGAVVFVGTSLAERLANDRDGEFWRCHVVFSKSPLGDLRDVT